MLKIGTIVRGALAGAALAGLAFAAQAYTMGDDGLHKQDWFYLSFKDVREDMQSAADDGKRLVIMFEQRGCIYCAKMHEEILSDPEISSYIQENFKVVQYNLFGDEEVTDLDGESLSEKSAARRWNVLYTPTIVFLPEDAGDDATVGSAAVSTMPGAFGKKTFLHMFQWVREKGYETDEHFQKYHARRLQEDEAS
jgi:thioredoxin-related protein